MQTVFARSLIELPGDGYWADVSVETLDFTTLGKLRPGARVNLEKALTPASRLGGHIVSGHVDGVGEVVSLQEDGRSIRVELAAPAALAKYIAHKGSICVDGTSLTVNAGDRIVDVTGSYKCDTTSEINLQSIINNYNWVKCISKVSHTV